MLTAVLFSLFGDKEKVSDTIYIDKGLQIAYRLNVGMCLLLTNWMRLKIQVSLNK